ncbi:hypothetical protein MMC18_004301 [Xylographa bjoerkii]|nr:hypothetical protein [Xylographa bjoerkii]
MSVPKLCSDCTNVLERVEQLELGSFPVIDKSIAKLDPVDDYEYFQDNKQFQESAFYKDFLPEDDSLEHKSTRTGLFESANSGCHLCRWLLNSLDSRSQMSYQHSQTRYRRRPAVVRKDPSMSPLGMRCVGHYYVSLRCARDERVWPVSLKKVGTDTHRSAYQNYAGDEKATLIIDSLRTVSKTCPRFINAIATPDDGSPNASTWTLFEDWLDLCTSRHPECRSQTMQQTEKIIPTRLLDIRDPEVVCVIQSDSCFSAIKTPRYATLSHCLDQTHEPQLNTETSNGFAKGVHPSNLPKTFRDAIIVAQRLKIPYLFIDSLCILQDSTQDWLKESSKMGSIYKNSYLCIAAAVSKDSCSGFLERRDLTHKRPFIFNDLVIQEDVVMPNNNFNMRQITWCDRMRTLVEWGVEHAPLNERAWFFQERMLAPRILHCTSDEFIWECCKGMRSESHPLLTNGGSVVKDAWRQLLHAPPRQKLDSKQRTAFLERWSELIATYSMAQFPRMDDKLIACSAITKELQPILGSYAAGLWRNDMPTQLLWSHHPFCSVGRRGKHNMRPKSKPSWSWASLDCRVELPYYYDAARDRDFNTKTDHSSKEPIDLSIPALVKVLDVNINLRGEDPTGLVDDGSIRLSCTQLFPLYRSAAFGWRLEMEPPGAFEQVTPVRWSWDDPNDFVSAAEEQIRSDAYKPGELSRWHKYTSDLCLYLTLDGPEEDLVMRYDSAQRHILVHRKKLAQHVPILTQMCCLPIAVTSKSGFAVDCKNGTVAGIVLEYTGEATGQYRRTGHFWCGKDYLDKIPKVRPPPELTLPYEWPSCEQYSLEDGYTISIV